jgi:tetratricopeptide (TPR) repeat protein/DNA-binding CsgD family transcriptional regulator
MRMIETKRYRYIRIEYSHYSIILLLLFLLIFPGAAKAGASPTDTLYHIFDKLPQTNEPERAISAIAIYKKNLRKISETDAMSMLDHLYDLAGQWDDKRLQWAVYSMRADYYSVKEKLNPKSTAFYLGAVDFAAQNNLPVENGIALNDIAVYYFFNRSYNDACRYFLQSLEKFKQVGFENVPEIDKYLYNIGIFYYQFGDFDNSKPMLEQALLYSKPSTHARDKINYRNTLGLVYRNFNQFKLAIDNFQQALQMAIASKDTAWIGIATGNIGSCYFLEGQYQKAVPYIETDYATSLKYDERQNAAIALLRLIKINLDNKNLALAARQLDTVPQLLQTYRMDVLKEMTSYYDLRSKLYELSGQPAQSIAYRKIFETYKDSLIKRDNLAAVQRIQMQYEADERLRELSKIEANTRIRNIETDAGLALLGLFLVILILVYNRQRLKAKQDKDLLLAEKEMVDERLKNARVALHKFTENIRQKNVLIENFKLEIDKLSTQSVGKEDADHLEKLLQAHIMTDENWAEFKRLFSKVYPGFFVSLSKENPSLSTTDTRIVALIKLGLNNAEMANMLGITIEGIKKAKQRLRKKMDVQTVAVLEDE